MFVKMSSLIFLSVLLAIGAPTLVAAGSSLECGVPLQAWSPSHDGPVARGQAPWTAIVYRHEKGTWSYECSGTLISPNVVVTAAHCVFTINKEKLKPEDIKIGLGKLNNHFDSKETDSVIADVREIVVNPHFHTEESSNFANDVALLALTHSVNPTHHINPACVLWEAATSVHVDDKGYVAEWPVEKHDAQHDVLRSSQVTLIPHAACKPKMPNPQFVQLLTEDRMCAERLHAVEDVHKGLAGAGVLSVSHDKHYIVGFISIRVESANNTMYLVTDMKNEAHITWMRTEKSRLDKLH